MSLRDTFLNVLGLETPEVHKTENSVYQSARDFLRYGNRADPIVADWSEIKISDSDMYKGYAYAVIQKRGNKVASLAKNNLKTWAKPEVVDAFQKKAEEVYHPYLTVIENSTSFTEKQFWKNISIYLDLAGVYYLGVVRGKIDPIKEGYKPIITDVSQFVMLNPYEIRRVVDKDGHLAGYVEHKKDGRERVWPVHQIIEMRELNPFDPEKGAWSITTASKEAVYTINKSGDYTRQSLNGNLEAPGIITTDLILSDEDFANFRERVRQHRKGEPLFGNGSGALHWENMQIDLDRAALMDINEINRSTLFAVSGTSKTALGIEQSGTTRETARVQTEQFVSDTAQPRLEDIVDFLNLDYKKWYPREYQQTGYYLEVMSAVSKDYQVETQATQMRQAQVDLALGLVQKGFTTTSAYQYAQGEIELEDLELEKGLDKPKNDDDGDQNAPTTSPEAPEGPSDGEDDKGVGSGPTTPQNGDLEGNNEDLNGLEPHADLKVSQNQAVCRTCENALQHLLDENDDLRKHFNQFLDDVREIEKELVDKASKKVTVNAFEESDLLGPRQKKNLVAKMKNLLSKYWGYLFLLFGNEVMAERNEQFNKNEIFKLDNDVQNRIDNNAERVADGHIRTIVKDVLDASNQAYAKVAEDAAAGLIVEAYRANPEKFKEYFPTEPTRADALKSIQKTDILEQNRRIYEKANKMAFEGYKRSDIVKAIRESYPDISKNRATLIARNETARAFGKSQYEADLQFLKNTNNLTNAFKVLESLRPESERDKICPVCAELIRRTNENPIPFTQPFLEYGESLEIVENGVVKNFTANYEDIDAGVIHPNCFARDTQLYTNEGWKRVDELTGDELFWSIDPDTKKPEWVKARVKVQGYAEKLLRFHNKNFDMATTFDHNMLVAVPHRAGRNRRTWDTLELVQAQDVKRKYRFYSGVNWEGEEPETIKLGDYNIPAELYCKFMGYYLSEGCANTYKTSERRNGIKWQATIGQTTHHQEFWNDLQDMPFRIWNGKTAFTFDDKSAVEYCMQFGKSHEKYIPDEIKRLSPRLLNIFLDAFVLGDGNRKYSAHSDAWATTVSTSSTRLRDDLTEVIQKSGHRPTVKRMAKRGDSYRGTDYKINHDVWSISICNKLYTYREFLKDEVIDYYDDVFCVELEKNHTLWAMYNGKCWWSGNCFCRYRLIIKGEDEL